jgi:hypothetical protein
MRQSSINGADCHFDDEVKFTDRSTLATMIPYDAGWERASNGRVSQWAFSKSSKLVCNGRVSQWALIIRIASNGQLCGPVAFKHGSSLSHFVVS